MIFGSDYQGDLMPDLRFGGTLRNQLVVIDPATLTITYQASLSGSVVQAVELPYGIAFETAPIHTLTTPYPGVYFLGLLVSGLRLAT